MRRSIGLRDRFGLGRLLLGVTALQTLIIGLMGMVYHALVVPLILLRSCYPAISRVLVNAAIAPRVPELQRATYLSLHSLAGRLGYAGVLYTLSVIGSGGMVLAPEGGGGCDCYGWFHTSVAFTRTDE